MKLATLKDGTRDGKLVVVSRDLSRYQDASDIAPSLQAALDRWSECESQLKVRFDKLQAGGGEKVAEGQLQAPLPRAYEWVDGSAFINHIVLVRKARNAEPPATLRTDPLVYQGGSSQFLAPTEDIPLKDESWGLDFESEVVVVLGDTPAFTKKQDAAKYVRLVMIANDVSLRNLIPAELEKGFGFFNSKPATALGPVAVTPDELGSAWQDGRVHLPLLTHYNGKKFGDPDAGREMHFSFFDLVEHICKTRAYTAGTLLGSGTISNEDRSRGSSCLAEKRMIEKIDTGTITTPFMKPGDTVRIEMFDQAGKSIFGKIDQKVVAVLKVFISADIEGVAGITAPEEANPEHRDTRYFQDQMTQEVKAACEGAVAAGAKDILVKDAHWTGRNINPRALPQCARVLRGWTGHPYSMMAELDKSFVASVMVGYHARAGSAGNPLAHTMSGRVVAMMRINEKPASEFLLNTLTSTMVGVPVAFLSGDESLCSEVKDYNENIRTVASLKGIGQATISPHPEVVIRQIRESVEEALQKDQKKLMRPLPDRFSVELDYKQPREAYGKSFYPGAKLVGDFTVRYESRDYFDILRMVQFCVK